MDVLLNCTQRDRDLLPDDNVYPSSSGQVVDESVENIESMSPGLCLYSYIYSSIPLSYNNNTSYIKSRIFIVLKSSI